MIMCSTRETLFANVNVNVGLVLELDMAATTKYTHIRKLYKKSTHIYQHFKYN